VTDNDLISKGSSGFLTIMASSKKVISKRLWQLTN